MHNARTIIGLLCIAIAVLSALAVTAMAVDTGAAEGHGLQLGTLLGADLVLGAGFSGAIIAAGLATRSRHHD